MSAADDPRWLEDPAPSFDRVAADVDVELTPTSPEDPGMNVDLTLQLFWPGVR